MRRVYNYNTGKLYESDGTYTISVTEKALSPDVEVNPDDNGEIEQKYLSYDEALDALDEIVDDLCSNEGFNREDADIVETDNGFCVTVPDYKQWCFVISGDVAESVNEEKKENTESKNESVSTRFSKLREMFESAGLNEEDEDEKSDDDEKKDSGDEKSDDSKEGDDEKSDDKKKDSDDDDEEKEMKAIVITVKKGDEDKCKDELIEAGVADEDIEILDGEEDDENVDIRIDVNSVFELKDYLEKKGIDLEEEIGGEIVDDSDDSDDSDDENGEEGDEEAEFNFDDLGDLFGADESDE